jgi:DNA-binding SARP family transcriptional activator
MGAGPGGAAAAWRVEFRVLGPLEVAEHGTPVAVGGPKERTVLAVLLARANGVVSLDALVDAVWSGRPPRTAERTVAAYVARLRAVVEPARVKGGSPSVLVSVGGGYRLEVDADAVDALRFERLAPFRYRAAQARRPDGSIDAPDGARPVARSGVCRVQ